MCLLGTWLVSGICVWLPWMKETMIYNNNNNNNSCFRTRNVRSLWIVIHSAQQGTSIFLILFATSVMVRWAAMFASCVVWRFEAGNLYFVYKNTEIPFLSLATDSLSMLRVTNTVYSLVTFGDINAFCSALTSYCGDPGLRSGTRDLPHRGRVLLDFLTPSVWFRGSASH